MNDVDRQPTYEDFTEVTLARPVERSGVAMPEGARGVVMAAYAGGRAYEVEFEEPVQVVLTLTPDEFRVVERVAQ
jgi:hypothetical protein